jgi:hypothetical protein
MFRQDPFVHAFATHVCGVLGKLTVSGLHRRSPVLHWTQVCVVMPHTGVDPLQAVVPVQWPFASHCCGVSRFVPPHRVLPGEQTASAGQVPAVQTNGQGLAASTNVPDALHVCGVRLVPPQRA